MKPFETFLIKSTPCLDHRPGLLGSFYISLAKTLYPSTPLHSIPFKVKLLPTIPTVQLHSYPLLPDQSASDASELMPLELEPRNSCRSWGQTMAKTAHDFEAVCHTMRYLLYSTLFMASDFIIFWISLTNQSQKIPAVPKTSAGSPARCGPMTRCFTSPGYVGWRRWYPLGLVISMILVLPEKIRKQTKSTSKCQS